MKKSRKIISGIVAFMLIIGILWFANGFVGNPISKFLANRSAERYIAEKYPDMELEVSKAVYNFKTGGYNISIKSVHSIDTHFSLDVSPMGDIKWDSYEDYVLGKFNTWDRVNSQYRKMVDDIFDDEDFPYESDIDFGEIMLERETHERFGPIYGLNIDELEIDKIYDIKELAAISGHLVYYIEDERLDAKRTSEILINIKDVFDQKGLPFYAIDLTLQEPRVEDDRRSFSVNGFLYSDIYEEGSIQRLEKSAKELEDYYEIQDSKKNKLDN